MFYENFPWLNWCPESESFLEDENMFLRIRRQYDLTLNAIQFIIEGSRKCHTFKYNHYNIVQECDVHETANKLDRMMKMLQAGKECFLTSYNTVVFFQIFIDWANRPFTPTTQWFHRPTENEYPEIMKLTC